MTSHARARLAVLCLALALPIATARAQQDDGDTNAIDDTPHVTIVGTARAEVVPDLATITLGVTAEKPTPIEASEVTAKAGQAIVAAAKAQGVAAGDLSTEALTLEQTFDETHDAAGRFTGRKPRGYEASAQFTVRLRDLGKAGALAQSLVSAGANRFGGIAFSLEHPEAVRERLAAEAVADARRQAQRVAEAAGIKLGAILLIEKPEPVGASGAPVFAARAKVADTAMPIEPGTSAIESKMAVTWAIAR